jgi:hypothetical protein
MISASPPGRAWIELGADKPPVCVIWRKAPHEVVPVTSQLRGEVIVGGEFAAADASVDDEARQELADVLYDGGSSSRTDPVVWLRRTLCAFPGCAVAAAWGARDSCAVATRQGTFVIAVCAAGEFGARFRPFACAAFVHGWLSAQWPVASLAGGCVEIRAGSPAPFPGMRGNADMRVPFRLLGSSHLFILPAA